MWIHVITALVVVSTVTAQDAIDADEDVICEPQVADTCFTDVEDDLTKIFNSSTVDDDLIDDLCSAWNDSLSCTSDIIDTSCQEKDGKLRFDHWNSALWKTWEFVCIDDKQILKDIFRSTHCFNITGFFYCIETTANLTNMQGLLSTDLDAFECWYLKSVIQKCGEYVTFGSCALGTLDPLNAVINAFFKAGDCSRKPTTVTSSSNTIAMNNYSQILTYIIFTSLFLTGRLTTFKTD